MQVGDWVRRTGPTKEGVIEGHVYKVRKTYQTGSQQKIRVVEAAGGWNGDRFEPFVWKVGDSCKIARPGYSISDAPNTIIPMSSLPIGKLTELYDDIYHRTDIPNPINGNGLLVKLSQLDFVNPDGSIVSFGEEGFNGLTEAETEASPSVAGLGATAKGLSTPPVEAPKRRYINRSVSTLGETQS